MKKPVGKPIYLGVYKPYGVISQFTKETPTQITLATLSDFPKDVYPVGRLDTDSEGLLLLTNDNVVKTHILDPNSKMLKTYWAQVEGEPTKEDLMKIQKGVTIKINSQNYKTLPANARLMEDPIGIPDRNPPIRFRQSIPSNWIEIEISEGKNRQIRKMCAAIGFPVLRLIRIGIGNYKLKNFQPGEVFPFKPESL
jgi:23S rRNA pseudouridine2457 synthase